MRFQRTSQPRAASAADAKRHDQIRAAVKWASGSIPGLPPGFADKAIAAGKSVDQVKADLLVQVTAASPRERSKATC